MSYFDEKGNKHETTASRDQANSTYETEKHAKYQTVTTAATAVAAAATAIQAKRAAEAAEATAWHAEAQALEAKKQTNLLEEKAAYERLLSFLDGETDLNRWKIIYQHTEEKISASAMDKTTRKLAKLWANMALFPKARLKVKEMVRLETDIKSDDAIFTTNLKELSQVTTMPTDDYKDAKPNGFIRVFSSTPLVIGFIIFLFIASFAGGKKENNKSSEDAGGQIMGGVIVAAGLLGLHYYVKKRMTKINDLKAKLSELEKKLLAEKKQLVHIARTIDLSEVFENKNWQLTPDECFDCIYTQVQSFQSEIPPRCRVELTREISKKQVEETLRKNEEFFEGNTVYGLQLIEEGKVDQTPLYSS